MSISLFLIHTRREPRFFQIFTLRLEIWLENGVCWKFGVAAWKLGLAAVNIFLLEGRE